ncbi:MAG: NERD domain-containing protein [Solirubrobacteraceae bacterium]|nr:NERD domain-containing protein [Solirubrobacteraceae bacterium]
MSSPQEFDAAAPSGTAGASARREYERRREARERRVRERHPRTAALRLALTAPPQHEQAWVRGAEGEEALARELAARCDERVLLLHDRRLPGSRGNVDHLAIAPTGVWVVDAKRYRGKVEVARPWIGEARLTIGGRDRSKLVDGLRRQTDRVAELLDVAGVPVHGALFFYDAQLPVVGSLTFGGFPILRPRPLARRLSRDGPLDADRIANVRALLAEVLPAA